MALLRRHIEELLIINILMNPKNEEALCVTEDFNSKLPMWNHNFLAWPPGVVKVAHVDLDKVRFVSFCCVTFDYEKAIAQGDLTVLLG